MVGGTPFDLRCVGCSQVFWRGKRQSKGYVDCFPGEYQPSEYGRPVPDPYFFPSGIEVTLLGAIMTTRTRPNGPWGGADFFSL